MERNESTDSGYRMWLVRELAERTRRNPAYSLRAFSKALGLSAPSLSQILSGKRPLSRKAALRIVERCALSEGERRAFLGSVIGAVPEIEDTSTVDYDELDIEAFRVISDWYHYALLSLGDIEGNRASPAWIAERLGISRKQADQAFSRLLRLGLLRRRGKGFYQSAKPLSAGTREALATALRKYHHQNLRLAEAALESDSAPLQHFSAVTMAVDESRLEEARELTRKFRRKLCRLVESGRRERVYTLAIQLFPVSKK